MATLSKRVRGLREQVEKLKVYPIDEAVNLLNSSSTVKFKESIDISINLGVDPRKSDQMVRGATVLPHGTGKDVRVAVFAQGDNAEEAKTAGADVVGFEDLAESVKAGSLDFDVVIATPDAMRVVGQLGRVLGPRGLMPNPKLGTVTPDVAPAIEAAKGGQVEFRAEKAGVIHAGIGKASFSEGDLVENLRAFMDAITKAKPSGIKGTYMRKVSICSTMGPGIRLDLSSLSAA